MRKNTLKNEFRNFYKGCFSVLKYYSCPESCGALCCRRNKITFADFEYKKIVRKFPWAKDILKNQTSSFIENVKGFEVEQYEFINKLCPFLGNNKCAVQSAKPLICELYPFTADKGQPPGYIALDPCPLGIELHKDYILFLSVANFKNNSVPVEMARAALKNELTQLDKIIKSSENVKTGGRVSMAYIPLDILPDFAAFLEKTPKELRMIDRRLLGIN